MPPRLLTSLILALSLSPGCAARRTPEDALDRYLAAEQTGRYDQSWRWLSASDQAARPIEAYARDHYDAGVPWLLSSREARARWIATTHVDPTRVELAVDVTHPDVRRLAEVLPPYDEPDSAEAAERLVEAFTPLVRERDLPPVTESLRWTLRQEDHAWRVWLGIAEQDVALSHSVAAIRAQRTGDTTAEVTALTALLACAPDPSGAVAKLQADARARLDAIQAADAAAP
jgi:hypothetical protein